MVERFNQTLQTMLSKFVQSNRSEWSFYLDTCVFAYNSSRHESTRFTPFEQMYGRRATLPIDIDLRKASPEEVAANFDLLGEPDHEKLMEERDKCLKGVKMTIINAQEKQKV